MIGGPLSEWGVCALFEEVELKRAAQWRAGGQEEIATSSREECALECV